MACLFLTRKQIPLHVFRVHYLHYLWKDNFSIDAWDNYKYEHYSYVYGYLHKICGIHWGFRSSNKLCLINCLFAHLTDLDLLPAACLLFHLANNIFVLNGKRLHLVFPLSRWFIILIFFRNILGALHTYFLSNVSHLLFFTSSPVYHNLCLATCS